MSSEDANPSGANREVELKAVVDDLARRRAIVEAAGARLVFEGELADVQYDTADRRLRSEDHTLRIRTYRTPERVSGSLDWKGPTMRVDGYKVREERSTPVADPVTLADMLDKLGYRIVGRIDRDIAQYLWDDVTIRFEQYPRMDILVEVEGTPDGIERAIQMLGMPREAFTTKRLAEMASEYEARTGERALTARE